MTDYERLSECWRRLITSTERADRPKAEAAVGKLYDELGFDKPKILWFQSPLAARLCEAIFYDAGILNDKLQIEWNIRTKIIEKKPFGYDVVTFLDSLLNPEQFRLLIEQNDNSYASLVADGLYMLLYEDGTYTPDPKIDDIPSDIVEQSWEIARDHLPENYPKSDVANSMNVMAYEIAHRGFFSALHGLLWIWNRKFLEKFVLLHSRFAGMFTLEGDQAFLDLIESAGLCFPYRNFCIMCERPSRMIFDERGQLHSSSEAAVVFADGWTLYAVHGIAVPARFIKDPQSLTVTEIDGEDNIEVRRVLMELYGVSRYLVDSRATEIDRDDYGILYSKESPDGEDEPLVMVRVVNQTLEPDGTRKEYFLRVPPEMRTARQAVAWTFGFEESEYAPDKES